MHNLILALHNYHDQYDSFPNGTTASSVGGWGPSWWARILPFVDQAPLYNQLEFSGTHPGWSWNGDPAGWQNGRAGHGVVMEIMLCPSSSLPKTADAGSGNQLVLPHYMGVGGASDGDGFINGPVHPQRTRTGCCGAATNGLIAFGGVMVPTETKGFQDMTDGPSNQIVLCEGSDFARDLNGNSISIQGVHGWLMGSPRNSVQPSNERMFNLTFVRYPPNFVKTWKPGDQRLTNPADILNNNGVGGNFGSNHGLYSAHDGGAFVATGDGRVEFISNSIDMETLRRLCTRDDGQPASF